MLAAALVALPGFTRVSKGIIIAGDSFVVGSGGYTAGSIQNQPAGNPPSSTGFSGQYTNFTSQFVAQASGLSSTATGYTGATGGSVQEIATSNTAVGTSTTPDSRVVSRALGNYGGASTYYFSALVQATGALNTAQSAYVEFSNHTPGTFNSPLGSSTTDRGFLIGLNGNGTTNSIVLQTASGTNHTLVGQTVTSGLTAAQTNLLIVRVDVNASGTTDNFTVYVNPTNVSTEALAAATAANVGSENFAADALTNLNDVSRLGFEAVNNGSNSPGVNFDELRYATTFPEVVSAVPEPATLGLLSFLSLGCLRRRR